MVCVQEIKLIKKTFRYKVGLLSFEVATDDNEITVKSWVRKKTLAKDRISAIGIADDVMISGGQSLLRVGEDSIALKKGPKGLVLAHDTNGKKERSLSPLIRQIINVLKWWSQLPEADMIYIKGWAGLT